MGSGKIWAIVLLVFVTVGCKGGGGGGSGTKVFKDSGQALGSGPSQDVALGDVDGDGDIDAFVANQSDPPGLVWINDGTGTFSNSGQALGSSANGPVGIALGDLDGDGATDGFLAQWGEPHKVFHNDGTGTFSQTQSLGEWNENAGEVVLGDLDGDGDKDAVTTTQGKGLQVWRNDGTGTFTKDQSLGSSTTRGLALADVDGGGSLDILAANEGANALWLNDGSGAFSESGQDLGGDDVQPDDVAAINVDGDGDTDAVFAYYEGTGGNTVWINDSTGNFEEGGSFGGGDLSFLESGDLNGDGYPDILTNNGSGETVVRLNDGKAGFGSTAQTLKSESAEGTYPRGAALADLDGDGDLDAFVVNTPNIEGDSAPSTVWLNVANEGSSSSSRNELEGTWTTVHTESACPDAEANGEIEFQCSNGDIVKAIASREVGIDLDTCAAIEGSGEVDLEADTPCNCDELLEDSSITSCSSNKFVEQTSGGGSTGEVVYSR